MSLDTFVVLETTSVTSLLSERVDSWGITIEACEWYQIVERLIDRDRRNIPRAEMMNLRVFPWISGTSELATPSGSYSLSYQIGMWTRYSPGALER